MTLNQAEKAQKAVELPQVREMIRRLSAYGLGVFVPHMHSEGKDFDALPEELVQAERNLQVTFEDTHSDLVRDAVPVAWRWIGDETSGKVACSAVCMPMEDGSHKELPT